MDNFSEMTHDELRSLRNEYADKKQNFSIIEKSIKILINSAYGAIGSPHFRLYDTRHASAITLSGQAASKWVANDLNKYLQKLLGDNTDRVLAADTDSAYLQLDDIVNKFCENSSDHDTALNFVKSFVDARINKVIEQSYDEFAIATSAYENKMHMKLEVIAKGLFLTKKKRYILKVYSKEGIDYASPEYKLVGIEAVRSNTPEYCKGVIKHALEIIFDQDEESLIKYLADAKVDFITRPFSEVGMSTSANNIEKYDAGDGQFVSGCPHHVKGAISYNYLIDYLDLSKYYKKMNSGNKVKVLYLKTPNPLRSGTIAITDELPPEFELGEYIDHDKQFEMTIMAPLQRIVDNINWSTIEYTSLESFFA